MSRKEKFIRFIAGIILFGPIYGIGMYLFSDNGFDWVETLIISIAWSGGMVVFETLWRKIKPTESEK